MGGGSGGNGGSLSGHNGAVRVGHKAALKGGRGQIGGKGGGVASVSVVYGRGHGDGEKTGKGL